MEAHRSNPAAPPATGAWTRSACGLENYDAIGAWRTQDGAVAIDASGKLQTAEPSPVRGIKSDLMSKSRRLAQLRH